MNYNLMSRLGEYHSDKYEDIADAVYENDYVVVDLVQTYENVIYLQGHHSKVPDRKLFRRLADQNAPKDGIVAEVDQPILQTLVNSLLVSA